MRNIFFVAGQISLLVATVCLAEERHYVVKDDFVPVYEQIQTAIPQKTDRYEHGRQEGLIYGNVVSGKPVKTDSRWIELTSPKGFVPAQSLEAETPYSKMQGRLLITGDAATVFIFPDSNSRAAITLSKGEVVALTGSFERKNETWYRSEFESVRNDESYTGKNPIRVGWISGHDAIVLRSDLDQGSIDVNEIPGKCRGDDRAYSVTERKRLSEKGLFTRLTEPAPPDIHVDDMVDLYQRTRGPLFISSDFFLHTFHLIFDRMLQDMEFKTFLPAIKNITANMYRASERRLESASSETLRMASRRNLWFFGVAGRLLDPGFVISDVVKDDVNGEIQRILNDNVALPTIGSPNQEMSYLPGFREDYTQYRPRGHYTLNDDLKAYFRVMMHYGRKAFMLKDNSATLSALLITEDLRTSGSMHEYESFSKMLDQLVGRTDDPSPREYMVLMEKVFGNDKGRNFAKPEKLSGFIRLAMEELPPQRIVSQQTRISLDKPGTRKERLAETTGFKFFGQRYTADAEFFQKLTSPTVGDDINPKNLPSALEVMALLGSFPAKNLLPGDWWKFVRNYPNSFTQVKSEVDGYTTRNWEESTYMSWLYSLSSLFLSPGSKQLFMNTNAWGFKSLNAALGSWSELKHDTILYAEQSYSESGEGGDEGPAPPASYAPPSIKGYVEPVPGFFGRLGRLNGRMKDNLETYGYLTNEYKEKLTAFGDLTKTAEEIAKKEVSGERITEKDFAWIREMPNRFHGGLLLPEGIGDVIEPKYLQMALIADVATDAFNGRVLLEGVGPPQELYVIVKDYWGGIRIAKGVAYTHYEFIDDRRWTDEEWKELVYSPGDRSRIGGKEHSWYGELLLR
jgi:hypothetical protein